MDTSEIDDSLFDFYSDPPEVKTDSYTVSEEVTVVNGEEETDSSYYHYDDDFETTSEVGGKEFTDESGLGGTSADSTSQTVNEATHTSSESRYSRKLGQRPQEGREAVCADDKSSGGTWRGATENGSRRRRDDRTSRRQSKPVDKNTARVKQVALPKQTIKSDLSTSNDSSDAGLRDRFTSYRSTTYSLDSYAQCLEDCRDSEEGKDTSLTSDTFSEALVRNDRFSSLASTRGLAGKTEGAMSYRKKMFLPQVDKSKRVQLTRKQRKSLEQTRTHAARVTRESSRRLPTTSSRPDRKPPIPIPLKSEALYCNGELTVNVRGDKRGNPDKNKFNVTITVVHKHVKSQPTPYRVGQRAVCRRRWRRDELDWDIVKHRAVLPGFNTATDPEVNRRYLQQFGI